MATATAAPSPIWKEIELAETHLVLCKNEEATSLACSIIKQLRENPIQNNWIEDDYNYELKDLFESAGMVLVQSMRPLGRTQDIMKELKILFGSVITIPPKTFLTGAQFQMFEGFTSDLQEHLEEFLNNWRLSSEKHYLPAEATVDPSQNPILDVEEYLNIFKFYVMIYLAMFRREIDLAVSWIQNGEIPEWKRQEFLEKLHYMSAPETTIPPQASPSDSTSNEQELLIKSSQDMESGLHRDDENSHQRASYFRWFPRFSLKIGAHGGVPIPSGNFYFGCLFLFACFVYLKKKPSSKRFVRKQAQSLKRALVDAWQHVFSYQVNHLAAVQSLPAITHWKQLM